MESSVNRSEKKKSRFNIVDALIIIIAFILAVLAFFAFDPFDLFASGDMQTVRIRYIVEFNAIDDEVAKNIRADEAVASSSTIYDMGLVTNVHLQQAYTWEKSDRENVMVKKAMAGKSDVFVTIESECTYQRGIGYFINGQHVAVGTLLQLRFADFVGSGYCVVFEIVE